jgi:dihydrofolate synthase/folylpolyglutamate synthase
LASLKGTTPLTALVCVLGDKDWRAMLAALQPVVRRFVLTDAPSAPVNRRWPLAEAASFASSIGVEVAAVPSFDEALALASSHEGSTLVTGSFHTVGDAMARLQVSPLSG